MHTHNFKTLENTPVIDKNNKVKRIMKPSLILGSVDLTLKKKPTYSNFNNILHTYQDPSKEKLDTSKEIMPLINNKDKIPTPKTNLKLESKLKERIYVKLVNNNANTTPQKKMISKIKTIEMLKNSNSKKMITTFKANSPFINNKK